MKAILNILLILACLSQIKALSLGLPDWFGKPSNATSSICDGHPAWTKLPHPDDCYKFYLCLKNKEELHSCLKNYYFDKEELICLPGSCPLDEVVVDDTPQKCEDNAIKFVKDDCTAYLKCVNGKYKKRSCRSGKYFDATANSCQPIVNNEHHMCSCVMPEFSLLKNNEDCNSYYLCVNRAARDMKCPEGEYFDAHISGCLPDTEGVCSGESTDPSYPFGTLRCKYSEWRGSLFRPVKRNCKKFYTCLNGRVVTRQCPKGFYFDKNAKICKIDTEHKCVPKNEWNSVSEAEVTLIQELEQSNESGIIVTVVKEIKDLLNGP